MSLAIKIYEAFKDDEVKAKVLSEVVDDLEKKIIPISELSTKGDLEITKLSLKRDIEEVKLTLKKEIKEVELTLEKKIEEVRLTLEKEIEIVRKEIAEVKSGIIKWVTGLLLVQTGVIVTIITLLK